MLSMLYLCHIIFSKLSRVVIFIQSTAVFYVMIKGCITKIHDYQIGGFNLNIPRAIFLLISIFLYQVINWPFMMQSLIIMGIAANIFSLTFKDNPFVKVLSYYYFSLLFAIYVIGILSLPMQYPPWLLTILSYLVANIPQDMFEQSLRFATSIIICRHLMTQLKKRISLIRYLESVITANISRYSFIYSIYNQFSLLCMLNSLTIQFKLLLIFILLVKNRFLFPWVEKIRQIDFHPKISLIHRQTTFGLKYPPPKNIDELHSDKSSILLNLNYLNSDEFSATWSDSLQKDYTDILKSCLHHLEHNSTIVRISPGFELVFVYQYLNKKYPENKNFKFCLFIDKNTTISVLDRDILLDGLTCALDSSSVLMLSEQETTIIQKAKVALEDMNYDESNLNIKEEITKIFTLLIALSLLPIQTPERALLKKIFERVEWVCAPHIITQFQSYLTEKPSIERYLLQYLQNLHLTRSTQERAATFEADHSYSSANQNAINQKLSVFFDFLYQYKIAEGAGSRDLIENILFQLMLPLGLLQHEDFHRDAYEKNISCLPLHLLGAQHDLSPHDQIELKYSKDFLRKDVLFLSPQDKATLIAFNPYELAGYIYEEFIMSHDLQIQELVKTKYKFVKNTQLKNFLARAECLQLLIKTTTYHPYLDLLCYDEIVSRFLDWRKSFKDPEYLSSKFKEIATNTLLLTMLEKNLLFYAPIPTNKAIDPSRLILSIDKYEKILTDLSQCSSNSKNYFKSTKWEISAQISTLLFMCIINSKNCFKAPSHHPILFKPK